MDNDVRQSKGSEKQQPIPRPATRPIAGQRQAARPAGTVKIDLVRVSDAARPWWADAPDIAWKCALIVIAPVRALAMILEMAVSAAFIAVFGAAALWWTGYIPDSVVAGYLADAGERALSILRAAGAF